jgi:hypothetical protein
MPGFNRPAGHVPQAVRYVGSAILAQQARSSRGVAFREPRHHLTTLCSPARSNSRAGRQRYGDARVAAATTMPA